MYCISVCTVAVYVLYFEYLHYLKQDNIGAQVDLSVPCELVKLIIISTASLVS